MNVWVLRDLDSDRIRITRVRFRGSNMFEDSGRIGTVVK